MKIKPLSIPSEDRLNKFRESQLALSRKMADNKKTAAQNTAASRLVEPTVKPTMRGVEDFRASQARLAQTAKETAPKTKWDGVTAHPAREVLARITEIASEDKARGDELYSLFLGLQHDNTSPYYNPYVGASNQKALQNLSAILG